MVEAEGFEGLNQCCVEFSVFFRAMLLENLLLIICPMV